MALPTDEKAGEGSCRGDAPGDEPAEEMDEKVVKKIPFESPKTKRKFTITRTEQLDEYEEDDQPE